MGAAGTHDNETMAGWWKGVQGKQDQHYVQQYSDQRSVDDIAWTTIRMAFRSVSQTCVFQMQVRCARWVWAGTLCGRVSPPPAVHDAHRCRRRCRRCCHTC